MWSWLRSSAYRNRHPCFRHRIKRLHERTQPERNNPLLRLAQPKKTQAAKRFSYATAISMTVTSPLLAPGTGTTRMLRKHQSKLQSLLHIPRNPGTRSMCPELGRSALDAVELMDVGVNYMREHMIDEARIHYAITDTGGDAPNVVQSRAQVLYAIRAPKITQVKELYNRVCNIAKGAAS